MKALYCLLPALALLAGCASVRYSSPGKLDGIALKGAAECKGAQLVQIKSSEYYALCGIPFYSGDARWNEKEKKVNDGGSLFASYTSMAVMQDSLQKLAASRDCDLLDVFVSGGAASLAGASYQGILGVFCGSTDCEITAVLMPRNGGAK